VRRREHSVDVSVTTFEYLYGYATTGDGHFILLGIYRPGSQSLSATFYDELSAVFELIALHSCPIVICGDLNIGAVSGNGIIKINLLLHAFPVVTAKERNVISIAFRHRSVHDGHIVEVLQVNGLDGTC